MLSEDICEQGRLACLRSLNILDTAADERLDRVTQATASHFDVPIALVSLVDEERQWFKSKVGLEALETPRCYAFCDHTIRHDDVMIVKNAKNDERFSDNPLVMGAPHIRFYAGAPIAISEHKIGTLCIIDTTPRAFSETESKRLTTFAHSMMRLIEQIYVSRIVLDKIEMKAQALGHGDTCRKILPKC